uniref:Rhophilin, Rho GTPase binding protein 2 n=1 Tax=Callorhinchus milii TaxID=7868 RepID=A0A4W3JFU0_CALMI
MTDTIQPAGRSDSYFRKGCNPCAQTGRSKLQSKRVTLNQQIIKAVRLRAGAENLLATDNAKVRDLALVELSYVNSDLQLLKEELEGLNSSVEVYQNQEEMLTIPFIPLGLKETREVDFMTPFKDFIQEHYSEEPSAYEDSILDVMDLRQATRTPSRDEAGVQLLISYYNQLNLLENRLFPPSRHLGIFFTWYDCFTGVPVCQQHVGLEKASILFNIAALHTQLGARSDRSSMSGLDTAILAFQRAAGVLNHLREVFTHTPSFDLSPAMLHMLSLLLLAQAQECGFQRQVLPGVPNQVPSLLFTAQGAAKVADVYSVVLVSVSQPPVREHTPPAWLSLLHLKHEHYRALGHYFLALALLDHECEYTLPHPFPCSPGAMGEGLGLVMGEWGHGRRGAGEAHLRRAIAGQEEALWHAGRCPKPEIVLEILRVAHTRSLGKYTQHHHEDDFDMTPAPEIVGDADQTVQAITPQFSSIQVTDFFHKLGPLSVFSAKQKWTAPRRVHLRQEAGDLGFTLRGEAPVQVTSLDPTCTAALSGLRDGDFLVSLAGGDCKWSGVSEVMKILKEMPEEGLDIHPNKSATYSGALPHTYSLSCLAADTGRGRKGKKEAKKLSFLSWGIKNSKQSASTTSLPTGPNFTMHEGSSLY